MIVHLAYSKIDQLCCGGINHPFPTTDHILERVGAAMPMYVYHADGHPVGFLHGMFIHDLEGQPLGRVLGSHVYRLDGIYVGEFYKETVVDKPVLGHTRDISPMAAPAKLASPGISFTRRGLVRYGYPDAFHRLYDGAHASEAYAPTALAAE